MRLDLSEIRNVLANVDQLLGGHDGEQLRPAHRRVGPLQRTDLETSALLHDLRLAQEFLQLATAELSAAGWRIQGQDDPRRSRGIHSSLSGGANNDINSRSGTAPKTINLVNRHPAMTGADRPSAVPRQGV